MKRKPETPPAGTSHRRGAKIEPWLVKLPDKGGHGVLVGDIVLTAAHCVEFTTTGIMCLDDHFTRIQHGERILLTTPIFIEPISDIAVLGAVDGQRLYDECEAFEQFCETTERCPVRLKSIEPNRPFSVKILNSDASWTRGKAERVQDWSFNLFVQAGGQVRSGASGGPILDSESGELVAINSNFSEGGGIACVGAAPIPLYALPDWIIKRFLKSRKRKL